MPFSLVGAVCLRYLLDYSTATSVSRSGSSLAGLDAETVLSVFLAVTCGKSDETSPTKPADSSKIQISVTEKGFEPESVDVPSGKPVTLVFTRKTEKTCAKQVVLMDDATRSRRSCRSIRPSS